MATDATSTYPADSSAPLPPRSMRLPATGGERLVTAALLFAATCVLYILTPTHLNTFDAVSYANQIAHLYPRTHDAHWLLHPHHLLFNAAGYGLWRLAQEMGYVGGPLPVLQTLNAVLGAAGITLFYLTLRRVLYRSRALPFLISIGLALTFGYWTCATDGRVNMPSTTLLLTTLLALIRLMEAPTRGRAACVGALAGIALLFHESAGLFVPVGIAGILLAQQNPMLLPAVAGRERLRQVVIYCGTWVAIVFIPYFLLGSFVLGLHSPTAFHAWSARYSELGWWWSFHILHNLRLDGFALRHAAFVEPPGSRGTFHIGRHVSANLSLLYWATLAGWFAAVYAFCAALPLLGRSHHRPLMLVCVLWIALYGAFFTIWSPGYFVFWVPVLAPISLLLALSLAHYRARKGGIFVNWLVGIWITLYAVLNIHAGIGPHAQTDASPFQKAAQDVKLHTQPGDVIVLAGAGDGAQCEVDIPYFADRDVVSLHTILTRAHENPNVTLLAAQTQMNTALRSGHSVYALDELWHNRRTWAALSGRHRTWTRAEMEILTAPYARTRAWTGPRGPVWRLTPLPLTLALH